MPKSKTPPPIEKDPDFPTILLCAMRYALGRETYMPMLVQDFIRRHPEALDDSTRKTMIRDIQEADRITHYDWGDLDHLGSTTIDRPGWLRFKEWLESIGTEKGETLDA